MYLISVLMSAPECKHNVSLAQRLSLEEGQSVSSPVIQYVGSCELITVHTPHITD